jgi:predicted  nucleic acid-binding Zn-ribbon protein
MSDENGKIENHTLVLLSEIRDRLDRVEKTQDQHGQLLDVLVKAVTTLDSTQQKQTEILKDLAGQGRNHGARLNAMYGRLGLIEKRVGLANA